MKKFIILLLFAAQLVSSQEKQIVSTYHFGHNGMEFIAQSKKGMVISTFNSKMGIREDIASKVYAMYLEDKIETNKKITINGNQADVTGKCFIRKRDDLVVVDFYYETIEWCSGIKEIYKKKLG